MACLQSAGSECSDDDDDDDDDDDVMTTTTTTCDGTRARGVARRRDVRRAVTLDGFISCTHACTHFMHSSPVRDDGE